MVRCQNCGQNSSGGSNFCRFCGSKFQQVRKQQKENYQETQPRPYSWQTDEFQVKDTSARPTQQIDRVQQLPHQQGTTNQQIFNPNQQNPNQQMQPQHQNTLSAGYHCPFCNSKAMPVVVKKVSPTGWAVFTILLITTFILFWIGLLIQEERRICPVCNMRVG